MEKNKQTYLSGNLITTKKHLTLHDRAIECHKHKKYIDAEKLYHQYINNNPNNISALTNLIMLYADQGRIQEIIPYCDKILTLDNNNFSAICNKANALKDTGNPKESISVYTRAVKIMNTVPQLFYNRGNAYLLIGDYHSAIADYEMAININQQYLMAYVNRSIAYAEIGDLEKSSSSVDAVLAINSQYQPAHLCRIRILMLRGMLNDALNLCESLLHNSPNGVEINYSHAEILRMLSRYDQSINAYNKVLELSPKMLEAYIGKGISLHKIYNYDSAILVYEKAEEYYKDNYYIYINKGNLLLDMRRYDDAYHNYINARRTKPDVNYIDGLLLHCAMQCCDWNEYQSTVNHIESIIQDGGCSSSPFYMLAVNTSVKYLLQCAKQYAEKRFPAASISPQFKSKDALDRIVIGYYSADYFNHATAHLISGMLRSHDRNRYLIIGFSFGPAINDVWSERVREAFEQYYDVSAMTDEQVAQYSRDLGVDIAIDLKGFTQGSKMGIFAFKPAPIVVNYLGYPGTLGTTYHDYIIADPTLITEATTQYYSEKIVYLPNCYQPNDNTKIISSLALTKQQLKLPESGFVYACFNNTYKITPDIFNAWMRILYDVDASVLWLIDCADAAKRNLIKMAESCGVDGSRIIFAERMPLDVHLARHKYADLFLDTLYYNAHTTASDALWAGLPVLTLPGESFASRVAASLLNTLNMHELIVPDIASYVKLATELAHDNDRLMSIKSKLNCSLTDSPLFDTAKYTRCIENAYDQMMNDYRDKIPVKNLHVLL